MDTTHLKGLLIVNRADEECLEGEGIGCVQPNEKLEEVNKELEKSVNEQNESVTHGGFEIFEGKVTIETKKDVVIESGSLFAEKDINIFADGEIKIESKIDSYVAHEEKYVDKEEKVHGFIKHPGSIASKGVITAKSPKMVLIGATVTAEEGIQLIVGDLHMVPVTKREEDYSAREQYGLFSTQRIEQKRSSTETLLSNILSPKKVYVEAQNIYSKGDTILGNEETTINANRAKFETYKVPQYVTTNIKSQGLRFPGITNVIIDGIEGRKISNSLKNNIAIVGAINSLLETKSATDLKPSMLFAAEAYTMANNMASKYQATGSGMEALMSEALNQFGVTAVNGIPIPSSIGFVKSKSQHSKVWEEVHRPKTGGKNFNFIAREALMEGIEFKGIENLNLKIKENFAFKSVPLESSYSFVRKNKGMTVSYDGDSRLFN